MKGICSKAISIVKMGSLVLAIVVAAHTKRINGEIRTNADGTIETTVLFRGDVPGIGIPVVTNTYLLLKSATTNVFGAVHPIEHNSKVMVYVWFYYGNGAHVQAQGTGLVASVRHQVKLVDGASTVVDIPNIEDVDFSTFHLTWVGGNRQWMCFDPKQTWVSPAHVVNPSQIDFFADTLRWSTNAEGYHLLLEQIEGRELPQPVLQFLDGITTSTPKQ